MFIAFHVNPQQPHQIEHSEWFKEGFGHYGLELDITTDIYKPADIHIVSGPHYAKTQWLGHPDVILIDRSYIPKHHVKTSRWASEEWISVGWMNERGGRDFLSGSGREPVRVENRSAERGTIFLADYAGPVDEADSIRLHPQRKRYTEPLSDAICRHAKAIGYRTTRVLSCV